MSGGDDAAWMEPWEKEMRAWVGAATENEVVRIADTVRHLIDCRLLRPVEAEPAEPGAHPWPRTPSVNSVEGVFTAAAECQSEEPELAATSKPPRLSRYETVAYVNWLCDQNSSRHSEIKTLQGRLDAAEAEIKAQAGRLSEAECSIKDQGSLLDLRHRDIQRLHGRLDGVARTIAQGLAAASDAAMKEVGK